MINITQPELGKMKFGSRMQKGLLSIAALLAGASTLYALFLSILTIIVSGRWNVFIIWAMTVSIYAPILVKLFIFTWRLVSRIS